MEECFANTAHCRAAHNIHSILRGGMSWQVSGMLKQSWQSRQALLSKPSLLRSTAMASTNAGHPVSSGDVDGVSETTTGVEGNGHSVASRLNHEKSRKSTKPPKVLTIAKKRQFSLKTVRNRESRNPRAVFQTLRPQISQFLAVSCEKPSATAEMFQRSRADFRDRGFPRLRCGLRDSVASGFPTAPAVPEWGPEAALSCVPFSSSSNPCVSATSCVATTMVWAFPGSVPGSRLENPRG